MDEWKIFQVYLKFLSEEERYNRLAAQHRDGGTVLHRAATEGWLDVVKAIVELVAPYARHKLMSIKDNGGNTALHLAVRNGRLEIIKCLSPSIYKLLQIQTLNASGRSVQVLRTAGMWSGVNFQRQFDSTDSCVKLRQAMPAVLGVQDYIGRTALHYVSSLKITVTLLDSVQTDEIFDLLAMQDVFGNTMLHRVAYLGYADVVHCLPQYLSENYLYRLLLVQDSMEGNTPVHVAAMNGNAKILGYLLNLVSEAQRTAVLALMNASGYAASELISEFGNVNRVSAQEVEQQLDGNIREDIQTEQIIPDALIPYLEETCDRLKSENEELAKRCDDLENLARLLGYQEEPESPPKTTMR